MHIEVEQFTIICSGSTNRAKEYGVRCKDVHIQHENYEISGLSGHAIPATRYMAKIVTSADARQHLTTYFSEIVLLKPDFGRAFLNFML